MRRTGWGTSIVLAAVVLSGCTPGAPKGLEDGEPTSDVVESPEPEETPALSPQEQRLEVLAGLAWDQYKTSPRDDMLLFTDALLHEDYDEVYQYRVQETREGDLYNFNPVEIASVNNSGDDILQQYWYMTQVSMSQRAGDGTTTRLDQDAAKKMATGNWYYSGDETIVTGDYNNMIDYINSNSEVVMLTDRYSFVSESELKQGVDRDGTPTTYKDIVFKVESTNAQEVIGRWAYVEYINKDGETAGRWMLMARANADEPQYLDLHD